MQHDFLQIEIDGEEIETLYSDLIKLEVELDDDLASMFRLRLCLLQTHEGWTNLDDERLRVWKPVTIAAGFEDNTEELFTGYITHIKPRFHASPGEATLDIWGMDASVLMDRVEKLKAWPSVKDSDIATEIFQSYGLAANVDVTGVVHDEAVSTIIQRETDMQFLKRLALRNGYECYVKGAAGFFKLPEIDTETQPILAVHFGEETNLYNFSVNVDAIAPANIGMAQIDRMNKDVIDVSIEASTQATLGAMNAAGILGVGMEPGKVFVGMNSASGNAEMQALCQGLYHKAEWFIQAEGEVNANQYQHVLLPRKPITVKGAGETYSGVYYVHHVTHVFTASGYTQQIKMKRNAILPTGDEDFGGGMGISL
jgi:phage protein D